MTGRNLKITEFVPIHYFHTKGLRLNIWTQMKLEIATAKPTHFQNLFYLMFKKRAVIADFEQTVRVSVDEFIEWDRRAYPNALWKCQIRTGHVTRESSCVERSFKNLSEKNIKSQRFAHWLLIIARKPNWPQFEGETQLKRETEEGSGGCTHPEAGKWQLYDDS